MVHFEFGGWKPLPPKLSLWGSENEFDGRAYRNPFEPKSQYPSVTTILKMEPKNDLTGWAARMVALKAIERSEDLDSRDPEKVLSWLQYAHNDFRDERAWIGSKIHAAVEAELNDKWFEVELSEEELAIMDQWNFFLALYDVEVLYTELTVIGDGYMGTLDIIAKITDKMTGETWTALIDLKTSKSVWPGHFTQLAALGAAKHALIEVAEPDDDTVTAEWTHPTTKKKHKAHWRKIELPKCDRLSVLHITRDGFDLVDVENVDLHYRRFRNYMEAWDIDQEMKKEVKNV